MCLITTRHTELRDGFTDLAGKSFTPAHVRDNPKIFTGPYLRGGRGLLIWDPWTQGTDSIHDMCVVNTDAVSYQSKTLGKCLETAELKKEKK